MKKAAKTKSGTRKTRVRRKKTGDSDAIKAFLLVGVIVALSALISLAFIMIHSSMKNSVDADMASEGQIDEVAVEPVKETVIQPQILITPPVRENEPAPVQTGEPSGRNRHPDASDRKPSPAVSSAPVVVTPSSAARPAVEHQGTLVFVLDDAGNNLRELDAFLQIPWPLTIAVLPGLPHSAEAARRIRAAGKEVILHQPMEAIGAQNPGPGAIYTGMSTSEIRTILSRNIAEIGPVAGINNHQGSKVTMDMEAMRTILAFCEENGIYFLDSRTTADTVAPAIARSMGMKIAERNIFIDNEPNKDAMLHYISNGLTRAQRNGNVIMIGHVQSRELAPLLMEQLPLYVEQGYTIKTVSDIIK